eukprot:gene21902-40784_t
MARRARGRCRARWLPAAAAPGGRRATWRPPDGKGSLLIRAHRVKTRAAAATVVPPREVGGRGARAGARDGTRER